MPALTFTRTSPGTYDPATDAFTTPVTTTITGEAIEDSKGDKQYFQTGSLVVVREKAFIFSPTTYALRSGTPDVVMTGDTCVHNGVTWTASEVGQTVGPDGKAITMRVKVSA